MGMSELWVVFYQGLMLSATLCGSHRAVAVTALGMECLLCWCWVLTVWLGEPIVDP